MRKITAGMLIFIVLTMICIPKTYSQEKSIRSDQYFRCICTLSDGNQMGR